jgi:hypothetical protein
MRVILCLGIISAAVLTFTQVSTAAVPKKQSRAYIGLTGCDLAAEWMGDVFLACHSFGDALPGTIVNGRHSGVDAYIVRFNLKEGKIVYTTRIGGNHYSAAFKVKVDGSGSAYAVGVTQAIDFPTTSDAIQKTFGGGKSDAFLVVISPTRGVIYSTFLGGSGNDQAVDLALDGKSGVYVAGTTWSSDYPGASRSAKQTHATSFLTFLKVSGSADSRSMLFGGSGDDTLNGVTLDGKGGIFLAGTTHSVDFPIIGQTPSSLHGASDAFLVRLKTSDFTPTFSSYFGGTGNETGCAVDVDRYVRPILLGSNNSADLPVRNNVFQPKNNGGTDLFVSTFSERGIRTT